MRAAGIFQLGVTGGIGSGKSTVAALLNNCGAALADADAIARSVTAPGGSAIDGIRHTFGADYIDPSGAMDRARMRDLVFADASAKQRLEAIIHPLIAQAIAQACTQAAQAGHRLIVLDLPLLTESAHWPAQLDAVLVVDCQESTQIARVQQRSGLTEAAVRAIMASQNSRAQRRSHADLVIYNEELSLAQLQAQVRQLAACIGL